MRKSAVLQAFGRLDGHSVIANLVRPFVRRVGGLRFEPLAGFELLAVRGKIVIGQILFDRTAFAVAAGNW
jgi:hypothetical protein